MNIRDLNAEDDIEYAFFSIQQIISDKMLEITELLQEPNKNVNEIMQSTNIKINELENTIYNSIPEGIAIRGHLSIDKYLEIASEITRRKVLIAFLF